MLFVNNIKQIVKNKVQFFRKDLDISSNGACRVLLYHRVCNYETDPQLLCVSPENFDAQIKYLVENFNVLTVEQFSRYYDNSEKIPINSILLTFDDGYADNFEVALPILEKYSVQALFYICTGNINSDREFWWDEIERHILLNDKFPKYFELKVNGKIFSCSNDINERVNVYQLLLPELRSMNVDQRSKAILILANLTGNCLPRQTHRSMNWQELKAMNKSGSAIIGAHTVHHPSLAELSIEEQESEILYSRQELREKLEVEIQYFSYPFGTKQDYSKSTIEICKKAGFKLVASNFPYIANRKSNRYAFPRFLIRDWDVNNFVKEINSFLK